MTVPVPHHPRAPGFPVAAIRLRELRAGEGGHTVAAAVIAIGEAQSVHVSTAPGTGSQARFAAGLDAFGAVYAVAERLEQPMVVFVHDDGLRRELSAVASAFPAAAFSTIALGRFMAMLATAENAISALARENSLAHQRERQRQAESLPWLDVATDASKSWRRPGAGVACVDASGIAHQDFALAVPDVCTAEVLAIELALDHYHGRKLNILTDSRAAIAALTVPGEPPSATTARHSRDPICRVRSKIHSRGARLRWVRGHAGHPLNETADRLAVAARRNEEAGIAADVRRSIALAIVEDLRLHTAMAIGRGSAAS